MHRRRGQGRLGRVIRFELRAAVVALAAYALVAGVLPMVPQDARAAAPRVVIVVGPVGAMTASFRAEADRAAAVARAAGVPVDTIYSPDATWPRVKAALQGASIVVYMGHGNGWPSPYRDSLFPKTQNGMGLNPTAANGDDAHQYFGEAYLARDVRLAPHAVVLLHHLCYASGNSEPGLPEGDLATAEQRVDNFAAGWLAAGAEAVLAEAYGDPEAYLGPILAGKGTIEDIWRGAPTAHGHVLAFQSIRTPGYTALMDPAQGSSGFYRSLVARAELRASEVARGAALVSRGPGGPVLIPVPPAGSRVEGVALDGVPTAGAALRLSVTLGGPWATAGSELGLGIRWDPVLLDPASTTPVPATPVAEVPADTPPASPGPGPATSPGQAGGSPDAGPAAPSAATSAAPSASGSLPPDAGLGPGTAVTAAVPAAAVLVAQEVPGDVVTLGEVAAVGPVLSAAVDAPPAPGLYRLVTTIHDADGVAFDASTQGDIPALIVRVTPGLSAAVVATDRLTVEPAAAIELPVTVTNTGSLAWVDSAPAAHGTPPRSVAAPGERYAELVGRWLVLGPGGDAVGSTDARATLQPDPGSAEQVSLVLTAPAEPGSYLLVLDVVSPLYGSLTAAGGTPAVVRVDVRAAEPAGVSGGQPRIHGFVAPAG